MATNRAITSNNNGAHALDVPHLARKLHVQLERYIEAQYPIRHPAVVAERHALLETAGVISREPFIEGIPGFTGGPRYHDLALPPLVTASFEELSSLPSAMVPPRLYKHQAEALEAFLGNDRDLVVVTGTGSGKTETFLLPILVRSLEEAKTRPHSFRMPGMRALILYPMNALVNDQLTRLRRLFGDQHFVSWFRQRYSATRPIRFGMYTSRTPYPGMMSQEKIGSNYFHCWSIIFSLKRSRPGNLTNSKSMAAGQHSIWSRSMRQHSRGRHMLARATMNSTHAIRCNSGALIS